LDLLPSTIIKIEDFKKIMLKIHKMQSSQMQLLILHLLLLKPLNWTKMEMKFLLLLILLGLKLKLKLT
jgi:hypothetical protein